VTAFVDSSVWYASVFAKDRNNARAKAILGMKEALVTTDVIVVETWLLLARRFHYAAAERFWERIRRGIADIERVLQTDYDAAWQIGTAFADQEFSIVDRTSFAVMERMGITRAASFDHHFAVYRYGPKRDRAFQIVR
jgi:predicted nucleic acid-binding protein